jgi:hypothetical protein
MNLRNVFRQFFGKPNILGPLTLLLEPLKISRGSHDGKRCSHEWPDVITIRSEFEHFLIRLMMPNSGLHNRKLDTLFG